MKFSNIVSSRTGKWVEKRIAALERKGFDTDGDSERFSSELYVLKRLQPFPFARYPDYTAPWHLVSWSPMRWDHVFLAIRVVESLHQPTGSRVGEPLILEPFQIFILLSTLGPENPETGKRLVKEGLLTLARKNGKTALVAAFATAQMILHPDQYGLKGQEIQVGAADREQAGITHTMCERFIALDDALGVRDRFHSIPSKKTLQNRSTLTTLKCLSSDAYRAHGGNPAMVLLDEIGNVPAHQAEEFYSVLTTGFGAQREPLTFLLSTQAPNDQHFFSQQVDRAKRINEYGLDDNGFAGFVFSVPETDETGEELDPFDESLWYLANPGLDTVCSREDMRDWAKKARDLPALQNKFENLRLNRRVSETSAFVSRVAWERNSAGFDHQALFGRPCWAGVDLSETTDLSALVLLFEEDVDGRMPVLPFFWIPGDGLPERSRRDKIPYDVWARQELIDASSHHTVDYSLIARKLVDCFHDYDVRMVGFDRWRMKFLRGELKKLGYEWDDKLDDPFLIEIGQGFKDQSRSIQLLEDAIVETKLAHAGHPILKWNAANAVVVKDPAGNRKFEKAKSFGRIDGLVALAMAKHAKDEFDTASLVLNSGLNDPANTLLI